MIHQITDNIFDHVLKEAERNKDKTYFIVHGCNAQGRMGSGIAKEVKERFPHVYDGYRRIHEELGLQLGDIQPIDVSSNIFVVNAITQEYYGYDGKKYVSYDALHDAFTGLNAYMQVFENPVLCFPKIGAGLAGGNWDVISTVIESTVPEITKNLFVLK